MLDLEAAGSRHSQGQRLPGLRQSCRATEGPTRVLYIQLEDGAGTAVLVSTVLPAGWHPVQVTVVECSAPLGAQARAGILGYVCSVFEQKKVARPQGGSKVEAQKEGYL